MTYKDPTIEALFQAYATGAEAWTGRELDETTLRKRFEESGIVPITPEMDDAAKRIKASLENVERIQQELAEIGARRFVEAREASLDVGPIVGDILVDQQGRVLPHVEPNLPF